jgi:hypothetical protein
MVLCVDGLDPDKVSERGYPELPYNRKLSIPQELYYKGMPHTLLVWSSIFQGKSVSYDLEKTINKIYSRDNWNYRIRKQAQKIGLNKIVNALKIDHKKILKPTTKQYHILPSIKDTDTVLDYYESSSWNIPTINPECVVGFPTIESFLPYIKRQYNNWKNLTLGMILRPQPLNVAYTNIMDALGHRSEPTDPFYLDLNNHIKLLRKMGDVEIMLISDHGTTNEGDHTDHAYLGCTSPVTAESVIEVRSEIEKILGESSITKEQVFWDKQYKKGRTSGEGSVGVFRTWKHEKIRKYTDLDSLIIDVGCGDLSFWYDKPPEKYIGIDISENIIAKNRAKHPDHVFINEPAQKLIPNIKAPVVLCLDVLFHIMNDDTYVKILQNLCEYSTELIFIYTWLFNPFKNKTTDGRYQTYRNLEDSWDLFFKNNFGLAEASKSKYDKIGCMYVFRRVKNG